MQKALKQTEADDVLVAMEPTGTYYLVFEEYLEQLGIEVAIVNGRDVRRTSEVMGNDSSKNDPRDALIISQLTVDGRYGPSTRPKEGDYAELRELISLRELLATDDIRQKKQTVHPIIPIVSRTSGIPKKRLQHRNAGGIETLWHLGKTHRSRS